MATGCIDSYKEVKGKIKAKERNGKSMDKIQDMENKQMTDAELEQVEGGRGFFDAVKARFFDSEDEIVAQNLLMTEEKNNPGFGVTTMEMRVDPKKKKKESKTIRL